MNMNTSSIEQHSNCEIVYVHYATASGLAGFLHDDVRWVWILDHQPVETVEWWQTDVPLNRTNQPHSCSIRNLCFDLQLPTCEFISLAKEFDRHGLLLIQSEFEMPNTLRLDLIAESQQNDILIQNGAKLSIYLPHASSTAQVKSFAKGHLASTIGT